MQDIHKKYLMLLSKKITEIKKFGATIPYGKTGNFREIVSRLTKTRGHLSSKETIKSMGSSVGIEGLIHDVLHLGGDATKKDYEEALKLFCLLKQAEDYILILLDGFVRFKHFHN